MTNAWQRIISFDRASRFRVAILTAYVWIIASVHILSLTIKAPIWVSCLAIFLCFAFSLAVACAVVLFAERLPWVQVAFGQNWRDIGSREKLVHFFEYFLFATLFLGAWLFAYWPGGFSPDSVNQAQQIVSGHFNDWHPVVHTIITFGIPYKLFGSFGLVVALQVLEVSLCIAYLSSTLELVAGRAWGWGSVLFIVLNPGFCAVLTYPWKDVAFAGLGALLLSYSLRIYVSRGRWLNSPLRMALFVAVAVLATLVRHNAVLLTAPLVIGVIVLMRGRRSIVLAVCMIATVLLVKGPIYVAVGVESPGNRASETLGLPMTILGNCMHEKPEALDDETRAFMTSVLPESAWQKDFKLVNGYNSIKYKKITNNSAIDDAGPAKVISLTLRSFITCNGPATRGLFMLPRIVLDPNALDPDGPFFDVDPGMVVDNDLGFIAQTHRTAISVTSAWSTIVRSGFLRFLFLSPGLMLLVPLFVSVGRWRQPTLAMVMILSAVYVYAFGTALLLTGADYRFFTIVLVLAPALTCISLCDWGYLDIDSKERGHTAVERFQ